MKKMKQFLLTAGLLLGIFSTYAQPTYMFNSPQGYGAGITGGGNGTIKIVTDRAGLLAALQATGAARIIVKGVIQADYMSVEVHDKTLLGLPGSKLFTTDRSVKGAGIINMKNSSNVIIRNITFQGPGAYDAEGRDNLGFENSTRMWVDHCDFQDGMDGNLDTKANSDNITISWCRFRYLIAPKPDGPGGTDDHRFTNLVGSDADDKPSDGKFSMTWQYCWWDNGCVERMTRARNAQLHFLNCYWNTNTGKVLLGLENVDAYVENSVFAGSGTKYKSYGGTVRLTSAGCLAPPADPGDACPKPTYAHEAISASQVTSAITSACGAGATLTVTEAGAISASCTTGGPTLITTSAENQTVIRGNAITPIVYTWGGNATGVTVTGLPAGLTGATNNSAKTYTVTGTPTASGTYNISSNQPSGSAVLSSGKISIELAVPTNINATSTSNSASMTWSSVSGATGYVINLCAPTTGPAPKKIWDFTDGWTITKASADANLVLDAADENRFNYIPATTNAALKFANGSAIPDVDGLLFTQGGATKLRLGFNSAVLYLNGAGIVVSIPCVSGDKVAVVGPASNAVATDRGYSVTGGTFTAAESSPYITNGILTQAGAIGTWVYTATSSSVKITTVTGGMNIQKIVIGGTGSDVACKEYVVSGGSTNTYAVPNLKSNTKYTYQVKATNGMVAEASDFSVSKDVTTGDPLGISEDSKFASGTIIYPNPSNNVFYISGITGTATISVSDLSGKLLFTKEAMANEAISTEVLVSGVYMVKIVTANGTAEKKLVQK